MSEKNKGGHPITVWTPEKIQETLKIMDDYIENTEVPILAEFCYLNDIRKPTLYEKPELANRLKKMMEKKEAQLEKGALGGELVASVAIFGLKQLGWKDKVTNELVGKDEEKLEVGISVLERLRESYTDTEK